MKENWLTYLRHQNDFIFKVLLFIIAVTLVVFFLPKEGKFKYEFQKNKPWVHEDLLAPFDFAINKTPEEIKEEEHLIKQQHLFCFNIDKKIQKEVVGKFKEEITHRFSDTLNLKGKKKDYLLVGEELLNSIYARGIIELVDEIEGVSTNQSILLMDENNVGEELEIGGFYTIKSAYDTCVLKLEDKNITASFLLSVIEDVIQHNVKFNADLTQKLLEEELSMISLVSGGLYEKEKIISTGELVTPEKYKILTSLKGEYENKLGSSNQSLWIIMGELVLVVLFFYSIFIFLKVTHPIVFMLCHFVLFPY